MPVDRTIVGNVAADVMGQLQDRFGEDQSANIRSVFLIVAVDYLGEAEELSTEVRWGVSERIPRHEVIGLLEYVKVRFF
jgi:hypothetical protein